ncbi:ATP-binding protein [Uliginosibacterium sp. H3]|uniref:ATP-binding protein n=1 Tax=Uliginosibacterium silvisoli TaxID=3114758 RepID=A0ABU6K1W4_9RHOO|nr:ATP-binding protein [Uliginosibacterium sp. H3]
MHSGPGTAALKILFIENSDAEVARLRGHLENLGYAIEGRRVSDEQSVTSALTGEIWDVVIADFSVPDCSVLAALELLQRSARDIPFIAVSNQLDEVAACQAMQAGAQDCLDFSRLGRLAPVIERERREACMRRERRAALDAMRVNDERFRALATNVPGMLFQMQVTPEGMPHFLYVSEASQMLLGMSAETLLSHDNPLVGVIVPEDREDFFSALAMSSERHATLNWEGRVLPSGADIKWINLRCSPRELENGTHIWEGVMWNITQSKLAEAELRTSREQLAELSNHLQRAKEEERDRIARDIHDVLGGTLVGIKISTSLLAGKMDTGSPQLERLRQIETMLDDAITTTGRVARELRPGILKEFGLAAAVESHAEDFQHRTGIPCEVLCADHDIETSEDASIALFRTYQEALTNISKHAGAEHVEVRLMQEGDEIVLEVSDNGRGMKSADLRKPKSFGLRSIRERLDSLGGTMIIHPRNPQGTTVVLRVPLHPVRAEMGRETAAFSAGQA